MHDPCFTCKAASNCRYCGADAQWLFDGGEDYCDALLSAAIERDRKEYRDAWEIYARQYDDET